MHLIKYQRIPIIIPSKNASVKFSANTDKLYERITGIAISLPYDNSYFGTTLQLDIAGNEIFPENFEAKIIGVSMDVPPDQRFYTGSEDNRMQEEASGMLIEGKLTDGGNDVDVTYPYTAVLYVRQENIPAKKSIEKKEVNEK